MKNHFNEILLRDKIYFFRKRKKRYFQFYQLSIRMVFFFETKNILFISLLFICKQVKKHDFLVRVYITHTYIYISTGRSSFTYANIRDHDQPGFVPALLFSLIQRSNLSYPIESDSICAMLANIVTRFLILISCFP